MNRRHWLHSSLAGLTAGAWPFTALGSDPAPASAPPDGLRDRAYWVENLTRTARPLLENLAHGTLRENMPVAFGEGATLEDRQHFTYLEAFGRLMAGMAPWLGGAGGGAQEQGLREAFRELYRASMAQAMDPKSPDFLNFHRHGRQPLVDAAFLAHALLRAPEVLWEPLDAETKQRTVAEMKKARGILPYYSNWLLFAAMIEAWLLSVGEEWDEMRTALAVRKHMEWYLGDGVYGDGEDFHWDYYNSYVIQPMLLDILRVLRDREKEDGRHYDAVLRRARRYAAIQERLISPEGTFPVIGRSIVYRFGAFQHLGQVALWEELPEAVAPAQVRCALTAVLRRLMEAPGTYDADGWLRLGLAGQQPGLAESYISTGSLYLTATGFLPLGLPPENAFWSGPETAWTAKRIFGGEDLPRDGALYD